MKKNVLVILAVLVFLSLGSNLFATHYTITNLYQIGAIQDGNDTEALVSALAGQSLTLASKWDGPGNPGEWTGPSGEVTEFTFVWNGDGVITHIVVKASTHWILYGLYTPLQTGDSQDIVQSLITNSQDIPQAISHLTGYTGTAVPEPATLMLLGLGLIAVPLAKKYTF